MFNKDGRFREEMPAFDPLPKSSSRPRFGIALALRRLSAAQLYLPLEYPMRSDLIFCAITHEPNRYLLCRHLAKATRALHRPGSRIPDTTNDALARFSRAKQASPVRASHEPSVAVKNRKDDWAWNQQPLLPADGDIPILDLALADAQ